MQMENKVTNEPDMAKLQDYQKGQSEPDLLAKLTLGVMGSEIL